MIKIIATDLDGTLTQHKSKPDKQCLEVLDELSRKYRLVVVGAGGCKRIFGQLGKVKCDMIGFYGMESASSDGDALSVTESVVVNDNRKEVTKKINQLRKEFGFQDYSGETVEFHDTGAITFPILGTAARLEDKLAFDPDRVKRRTMYHRVAEIFCDYTVFIGGSSSFDIVPKPYCKLYGLNQYLKCHHIERSQVVYFGDDYGPCGNDEDVYKSDIRFVCIDHYRDFPMRARSELL